MDSSRDEREPSKDQSSSDQFSNRDAPPPHTMHYPAAMGYPGNGGQPHYGAYPNEYPQPQGYNHPAPATLYYGAPKTNNDTGCRAFIRSFVMCSCIIFTGFFIIVLIMAIVLNPAPPLYKLYSLSVVNFSTTPTLAGDWNTSFTVENPNSKLKGFFPDFKVDVMHKFKVLAVGYSLGFELDKLQIKQLDVKASSNDPNVMPIEKWNLDEIAKERDTGSVTFTLRISSIPTFKSSLVTSMDGVELAICEEFKVVFQNNTGTGTLDNGGKPIECHLYLQ